VYSGTPIVPDSQRHVLACLACEDGRSPHAWKVGVKEADFRQGMWRGLREFKGPEIWGDLDLQSLDLLATETRSMEQGSGRTSSMAAVKAELNSSLPTSQTAGFTDSAVQKSAHSSELRNNSSRTDRGCSRRFHQFSIQIAMEGSTFIRVEGR